MTVSVCHVHDQSLTCEISSIQNDSKTFASFIYGDNLEANRELLWKNLLSINLNGPWLVLGDFNSTLSLAERKGRKCINRVEKGFIDCCRKLHLSDLPYTGCHFTWLNRRKGLYAIRAKLDRALANPAWFNNFPDAKAHFYEPRTSDHSCIEVVLGHNFPSRPKPFKFFTCWSEHENFIAIVKNAWSTAVEGSPMFIVSQRLKVLKAHLKNFSKNIFLPQVREGLALEKELVELQAKLLSNQDLTTEHELEADLYKKVTKAKIWESAMAKQKARIRWHLEGDKNSAFFHAKAKARRGINNINKIKDSHGCWQENPTAIIKAVLDFYTELLGPSPASQNALDQNYLNGLFEHKVSPDSHPSLERIPSRAEIKEVLFSIPSGKSPGPDGFPSDFFKICWDLVGNDICAAIQHFFQTGHLLKEWNATAISLIPKKDNPSCVSDYRPISCCGTLYKVISKILANRISPYMSKIISKSQSGFIGGRLIGENVLVAQEIIRGYNRKGVSPRMALKVDIHKAYDMISWEYIEKALIAVGFPNRIIGWIMQLVTTPSYTIKINGSFEGFFRGTRGLRQGDPLSPFLFVIGMEGLSGLLRRAANNNLINWHPGCKSIFLNHLAFADDLFVFARGDLHSANHIRNILNEFHGVSGLQMSTSKSEVFLGGCGYGLKRCILAALECREGSLPVRYLGLPLSHRGLSERDCWPLIEKIKSKLFKWSNLSLSFAGRLELIKSVLYGIVNYWIAVHVLPVKVIKKVEGIMARFLWKGRDEVRIKHRVKWSLCCLPKEEGGLGLRRIEDLCKVTSIKLIWRYLENKNSIWHDWVRQKFLKGRSIWVISPPASASIRWKAIMKVREDIRHKIKFVIGNGQQVDFWEDWWCYTGPLILQPGIRRARLRELNGAATVEQIIKDGVWECDNLELPAYLLEAIYQTPIHREQPDRPLWVPSNSMQPSSKVFFNEIRARRQRGYWSSLFWFKGHVPKFGFFAWLVSLGRISTFDKMIEWNIPVNNSCLLCHDSEESRNHLFFECKYSKQLLQLGFQWCCTTSIPGDKSWPNVLNWFVTNARGCSFRKFVLKTFWICCIHRIWKERNLRLHHGREQNWERLMVHIKNEVAMSCSNLKNIKRNATHWEICQSWGINLNILSPT